jgi:hypothetical protein
MSRQQFVDGSITLTIVVPSGMFSIMYGQLSPIKLDVDVEPKDP